VTITAELARAVCHYRALTAMLPPSQARFARHACEPGAPLNVWALDARNALAGEIEAAASMVAACLDETPSTGTAAHVAYLRHAAAVIATASPLTAGEAATLLADANFRANAHTRLFDTTTPIRATCPACGSTQLWLNPATGETRCLTCQPERKTA